MAVYRIEVRATHPADDPTGPSVLGEIRQIGISGSEVTDVRASRLFLIQGSEELLTQSNLERIAREVLIDPVTETFTITASHADSVDTHTESTNGHPAPSPTTHKTIEVHLKPGVMDPVAASCEMAINDLLAESPNAERQTPNDEPHNSVPTPQPSSLIQVRTGRKFELLGHATDDILHLNAKSLLDNETIETCHFKHFTPQEFPTGHAYQFKQLDVPIRELSEEGLLVLYRKGHLFLDLREMQAIQYYFKTLDGRGDASCFQYFVPVAYCSPRPSSVLK